MTILWFLPMLGTISGALYLWDALENAKSGPQQAAGAALACALAIVPYVLVRAIDEQRAARERTKNEPSLVDWQRLAKVVAIGVALMMAALLTRELLTRLAASRGVPGAAPGSHIVYPEQR